MRVTVANICKTYGHKQVLHNLNAEFAAGECNILIGPNGAGKTTLLRVIGLLEKPSSGQVMIDGSAATSLRGRTKTLCRRRCGFVFQHPILFHGTVRQNLVYGLGIRHLPIDPAKVDAMLRTVGLGNKSQQAATSLSGGEKQRLQLARVMLLDPDLYLMDEPTANLDPLSAKTIETVIGDLTNMGKTVILSTHNLMQARLLGTRCFFMNDGQIVQQGHARDIFSQPVTLDMADFLGAENMIRGQIHRHDEHAVLTAGDFQIEAISPLASGAAAAVIRPEDILISRQPITSSARNNFHGRIVLIEEMGIISVITVVVAGQHLRVFITRQSAQQLDLAIEMEIYLTIKVTTVHIVAL